MAEKMPVFAFPKEKLFLEHSKIQNYMELGVNRIYSSYNFALFNDMETLFTNDKIKYFAMVNIGNFEKDIVLTSSRSILEYFCHI